MTTVNQIYDHPTYTARQSASFTSVAGNAAVGAKFTAFTALLAWSATAQVQTVGTSAGAGAAAIIQQISAGGTYGTTTLTAGTYTLGTISLGSSAVNTVFNLPLSSKVGGVQLLQGDRLQAVNGTDSQSVFTIAYEYSVSPLANVTQ